MEARLTINPIFDSYLLVAIAALVLLAVLALRPTFGRLSRRQRWILLGLRCSASLFLVVALLRPAWVYTSRLVQPAVLIVMFDTSQSMELPSGTGELTRWQAQRQLLEQVIPLLNELGARWQVEVYGYDRELRPFALAQLKTELPERPTGKETDIGGCLDQAIRRALGKRVGAIILMGDGVVTAYDPKVEVHEAAQHVARMGVPLWTVAFGQPGDTGQVRDVAVENLPEQFTAFVKNELLVRGVVRVGGYANQPIPVELLVMHPDGKRETIGPKEVTIGSESRLLTVEFSVVPPKAGQYRLVLQAPAQPGEINTANNSLTSFLTVLEGGLRVLYVYGSLTGEQRYLRWSLASSPDIQLQHIYIDPRNQPHWPDPRSAVLQQERTDVVLLENLDASAFRMEDWRALARWVEQGTGLMMLGGYRSFGPGGYAETPLVDVLPVEMQRWERQDPSFRAPPRVDTHWSPEGGLRMLPATPHPIVRLASDAENDAVWRKLPPLLGANRFVGLKPTARVLAAGPNNEPLLVASEYGRGRVLAFAGDSTYRWWQYGYQQEHKRFWRQTILWLAHREDDPRSEVWLQLPKRRFAPRAAVELTAGVRSPAGDAETDAELEVVVVSPDGQRRPVELTAQHDHWSATLRDLEQSGDYRFEAIATRAGSTIGKAEATVQVVDVDIERSVLAADPDQLARMALATRDAGGKLVAPEELPQVIGTLKERSPDEVLSAQRRWRFGDTTWDAAIAFLLIVGLWCAEWFLRRRWGLV